jgi:hypothetical protein
MYIKLLIFVFFISSFVIDAQAELSRKEKAAIGTLIAFPAAIFGGIALKTLWDKNKTLPEANDPGELRSVPNQLQADATPSVGEPGKPRKPVKFARPDKEGSSKKIELDIDHGSTIFDPDAGKCGFAALCAATGKVDRSKLKKGPGGLVNSDGAISESDIDNMILDVSSVMHNTRSKNLKEASERMRQNKEGFLQRRLNNPNIRWAGYPGEDPDRGMVALDAYHAILWAQKQKRNLLLVKQTTQTGDDKYQTEAFHEFADDPKEKPIVLIQAPYRSKLGNANHWKAYMYPEN